MNHERAREMLHDYLDGSLPAADRTALQEYLQQNPDLQREATELRCLLEKAAALPRDVKPARDLWPGIAAAIVSAGARCQAGESAPGSRTPRKKSQFRFRFFRWIGALGEATGKGWRPVLASAAVAFILVAALLTLNRTHPPGEALVQDRQGLDLRTSGSQATLTALGLECAQHQEVAIVHLIGSQEPLAVSSQGIVAHNLRIVDLAIADVSAAWAAYPQNHHLTRLLTKAYRARAGLQSRAVELVTQI